MGPGETAAFGNDDVKHSLASICVFGRFNADDRWKFNPSQFYVLNENVR